MSGSRRSLSDGFWLSLASTFGARRALHERQACELLAVEPRPLAAFCPENPSEVSIVLESARSERIPVVVCGECSRLRGGLAGRLPDAGYVALSTRNLAGVDEVHAESLWMSVRAGTTIARAVEVAGEYGVRPAGVSGATGTVGGWLASRGAIDDFVLGIPQPPALSLEGVLPTGNLIHSVPVPRSAVGPDLFSLFTGTWGGFGVITRATLKLTPLPERRLLAGFSWPSVERAVRFLRAIRLGTFPPARAALFISGTPGKRIAQVAVEHEGDRDVVAAARRFVDRVAREARGRSVGEDRALAWLEVDRFGKAPGAEGGVAWSRLVSTLKAADRKMGGYSLAVVDRPTLTGCRLRLALASPEGSDLAAILDPKGRQASALQDSRALLGRIREQLDPDGLLNPQAWPLPWPGEGP